jgi:hypothetical protein
MTLYTAALFLHIVGALLLFAALTLDGIALRQLRRATTPEQVRDSAGIAGLTRLVGQVAALAILVPGLYLTATSWGWVPWILAGLAAWVFTAVLGTVVAVRPGAMGRSAAAGGKRLSPELAAELRNPIPLVACRLRVAIVLGVVFLMTAKPDLFGSVLALLAATVIGAVARVDQIRPLEIIGREVVPAVADF